jgi:integrase
MKNFNHPRKGSMIRVDPIRSLQDIDRIKVMLQKKPRDLCFFVLGINTNLRASDLLGLRVHQVMSLIPGDEIVLREKKTGKPRYIKANKAVVSAVNLWLERGGFGEDYNDWLFPSQKRGAPLTVPAVSRMVKWWCQAIGLKGNYAAHSLRKTWGYHQRVTFGVDLAVLMTAFNHSSQAVTLNYVGISREEVGDIFSHEL